MKTHLKITAPWNELKAKLKQKYPKLTDTELAFSPGKEDELTARLAKKIGVSEDEVNHVIDDFQSELNKKGGAGRGEGGAGRGEGGAGRGEGREGKGGRGETEY